MKMKVRNKGSEKGEKTKHWNIIKELKNEK
jgi:hypothetical protein